MHKKIILHALLLLIIGTFLSTGDLMHSGLEKVAACSDGIIEEKQQVIEELESTIGSMDQRNQLIVLRTSNKLVTKKENSALAELVLLFSSHQFSAKYYRPAIIYINPFPPADIIFPFHNFT